LDQVSQSESSAQSTVRAQRNMAASVFLLRHITAMNREACLTCTIAKISHPAYLTFILWLYHYVSI